MKIAVGSDRRGFDYKYMVIKHLQKMGYEVIDVGPYDDKYPVDYPIYGEKVGLLVASKECRFGILVCATGIGIMIASNKVHGVRCGIAYNDDVARLMREHNNANVIAFGQDHMDYYDVERRIDIFLKTEFLGDYHVSRIREITDIENGKEIKQSRYINKK